MHMYMYMYGVPVSLHLILEGLCEDASLRQSSCNHQTLLQTVEHVPQHQELAQAGTNWEGLQHFPDEREIPITRIDNSVARDGNGS